MRPRTTLPRSLATLLDRLIDYAGLFPPAALDMSGAVRRFASYRASPDAWALGRFVLPVARLGEFDAILRHVPAQATDPLAASRAGSAASNLGSPPGARSDTSASPRSLSLTVLATLPVESQLARIERFNEARAEGAWQPRIESVEVKVTSPAELAEVSDRAPRDLEVYFEVPLDADLPALAAAAATAQRGLKIRTGGTTIDAFPPSAGVARFLGACAAARIAFKATAGLHHPVRSAHPVTYDPAAPGATMHGFLNVFAASALLFAGQADVPAATRVLEDELPGSFCFDDQGLAWRDLHLDVAQLAAARTFARSFGSCSFEEPLSELAASGILM